MDIKKATSTKNAQVDTKPVQEKKKPAQEETGFCVYLGPTILGVIQSGTVYPGSVKAVRERLAAVIEKYPLIARLLAPGETLAQDRKKVKTPGNALYSYYTKLISGGN